MDKTKEKEEGVSFRGIARHYWHELKAYKWTFVLLFLIYGFATLAQAVIIPIYYKKIVDVLSGVGTRLELAGPLMQTIVGLVIVMLSAHLISRLGDFILAKFHCKMGENLNNYAFKNLHNHSYRFFVNNFAGSLVTRVRRFTRSFEYLSDNIMFNFWRYIILFTGIFIVLFVNNSILAVSFLIWVILYLIVTTFLAKKKVKYDYLAAEADSRVTGSLADAITNVFNIKMFAAMGREISYFGDITHTEYKASMTAWNFDNFTRIFQSAMIVILEFGGIYLAAKLWIAGSITTGTVVLVQVYIATIGGNLWNVGRAIAQFVKHTAEASELAAMLDQKPDIIDIENPETSRITEGNIVIGDLNFAYGERKKVFKDFNLQIPRGQKVGLVGHSGVGKSTITKLLLRFSEIDSGVITIDGQDITKITQDDLRRSIAYIPQEPLLFHRSLRENIAYGRPEASEDEIIEAAKRAHAHDFIVDTPDGYDTLVGERGVKLSGGERQRVAIARAMLKRAPILILDEATSSLDAVSETLIQEAFAELMSGRTTIVIAHRLATVQKMDRIVVLGKEGIAEEGTHTELVKKDGVYANLWKHQTSGFIE